MSSDAVHEDVFDVNLKMDIFEMLYDAENVEAIPHRIPRNFQ